MQTGLLKKAAAWWSGPAGAREVLRMAVPLIVSTASLTIMMFVDRMFLCWSSEKAVAAVLPAGMTYLALVCFPLGIASYVKIFRPFSRYGTPP